MMWCLVTVVFFKQKTAYEMRISDWSSDVCSSDLFELGGKRSARIAAGEAGVVAARARGREALLTYAYDLARAYAAAEIADRRLAQIGSASCRERVCQYV